MTLFLLEKFSRVDWKDLGGRTALYFAVKNENLGIVKILLMYNGDPSIKCDNSTSAIDICKNKKMKPFLDLARIVKVLMSMVNTADKRERIWRQYGLIHFETYNDDSY